MDINIIYNLQFLTIDEKMKKNLKIQNYNFDKICIMGMLRRADIIPTKQRVALASLMFGDGQRHFTAEKIHGEAIVSDLSISLGTIYNTLNHFSEYGLLNEVHTSNAKTYFDTNTSDHHHFIYKDTISDIDNAKLKLAKIPKIPKGKKIKSINITIDLMDDH